MQELYSKIADQLALSHNWLQLGIIFTTIILSWVLSKYLNSIASEKYSTGLIARLFTPTIVFCFFLLIHGILLAVDHKDNLIKLAIPMVIAMMIIRTVIYTLRKSVPQARSLKAWEGVISAFVWVLVALYIAGWLPQTIIVFESIGFNLGKKYISVLLIVKMVASLAFFLLLANWIAVLIERQLVIRSNMTERIRLAISKSLRVVFVTIAIIVALDTIGIDITALTVLGGALGVGIGFGLQRIASNFISGFIILFDRSIRPGDVITIGDRFGWIQELRARYVVIRDRDGVETLIPNENLITSQVINWSYSDKHVRQKLSLLISYEDDPEQAMQVMVDAATQFPRTLKQPQAGCRLMEFADHGIKLELRYWISDPQNGVSNIRSSISIAIWKKFKELGITIPYPQSDVHLKSIPSSGFTLKND